MSINANKPASSTRKILGVVDRAAMTVFLTFVMAGLPLTAVSLFT
jgi:hypothetical protein